MENEKKMVYIFMIFPTAGNNGKKTIYNEKKNCCAEPFWATAQIILSKKKNFVLQEYDCIVTARRCS